MNILYTVKDLIDQSVYDFLMGKGFSVDMKISSLTEFEVLVQRLQSNDCIIIDNVFSLQTSLLGLIKIFKAATEKNIRIVSADGRLDISYDPKSRLILDSMLLAYQIDSANRSVRTRQALQIKKSEGAILGRRKGWRKKIVTEDVDEPISMVK